MILQTLSLISGILFVGTIILATNLSAAKAFANQRLSTSLQVASDRALNDVQTWARDTLALAGCGKSHAAGVDLPGFPRYN